MSTEIAISIVSIFFALTASGVGLYLWSQVLALRDQIKIDRIRSVTRDRNLTVKYQALLFMSENDELGEGEAIAMAEDYLLDLEVLAKKDIGMLSSLEVESQK